MGEDKKPYGWRWTRITNHKKDTAEQANAAMIHVKTEAPVIDGKAPVIDGKKWSTLEDIEKDLGHPVNLYAHAITRPSGPKGKVHIQPATTAVCWVPAHGDDRADATFSPESLGQWVPSGEEVVGKSLQLSGLLRPVFEVTAAPGETETTWTLQPPSGSGRNPLHLCLIKNTTIKGGHFVAL